MERFVFIVSPLMHAEVTQHLQTFDELGSLTWILESGDIKLNDNCIVRSNGSHYNNGHGDLEVREEQEERFCADLRSGEGKLRQQSVRRGLASSSAVLSAPLPSIQSLTQQPSIAVTLWVWHSTFALTFWPPVTAAAERLGKVRVQGRPEGWLMAEKWAWNGRRGRERRVKMETLMSGKEQRMEGWWEVFSFGCFLLQRSPSSRPSRTWTWTYNLRIMRPWRWPPSYCEEKMIRLDWFYYLNISVFFFQFFLRSLSPDHCSASSTKLFHVTC